MNTAEHNNATTLDSMQWHPPFYASMRLETLENSTDSIYEEEYVLNTKPLQLDMVLRKKQLKGDWGKNGIVRIFRKHNIIEFKSPDDNLDLDVFYKTIGCACLYKSYGTSVDQIKKEDITLTFLRERKPLKLFKQLEEVYEIRTIEPGIYVLAGEQLFFPIQFLVLREMEWEKHIWLTALQKKITVEHAKMMIREIDAMEKGSTWEWVDSVLQLALANNKEVFEKAKGDETMCQAFRELMAKEIDEALENATATGTRQGLEQGMKQGMKEERKNFVNAFKRLRSGESCEAICNSGINAETVAAAAEALQGMI